MAGCAREPAAPPVAVADVVDVPVASSEAPKEAPREPTAPPSAAVASSDVPTTEADDGPPPPLDGGAAAAPAVDLAGKPAPTLALARVGRKPGERVSLAKLKGKVVVVHFFATWAPPSLQAIDAYAKLRADLGDAVAVVAVSVDDAEGAAGLSKYVATAPTSVAFANDADHQAAGAWNLEVLPSSYVVDREGTVREVVRGFSAPDAARVRAKVEALAK